MTATESPAESRGITGLLASESARRIIEPLLFPGTSYRRVMQEVYLAVKDNTELLECTPSSIVRAVSRAASWGLVIGETVHLVPFNQKVSKRGQPDKWEKRCKALQDYKGKIELIVRSGSARAVDAEDVYENDDFVLELGANPIVRFRPLLDPKKRGNYIGTYAVARLAHDIIKALWVPASEVEEIRQENSKKWKTGERPYWYGKKTAIHRLAKELPKSERLAAAFREDEEEENGVDDSGPILTIGAPPAGEHHVRPVATSGVDAYSEEPRQLTEGAAQPIVLDARPHNLEAARAAVLAMGDTDPYTGERVLELGEPDFSDAPFPEHVR